MAARGGCGWRWMGGKTERITCVDDEERTADTFACRGFRMSQEGVQAAPCARGDKPLQAWPLVCLK